MLRWSKGENIFSSQCYLNIGKQLTSKAFYVSNRYSSHLDPEGLIFETVMIEYLGKLEEGQTRGPKTDTHSTSATAQNRNICSKVPVTCGFSDSPIKRCSKADLIIYWFSKTVLGSLVRVGRVVCPITIQQINSFLIIDHNISAHINGWQYVKVIIC